MTSPMNNMPVTSPSPGMTAMSPMNPPSQSAQPSMSPQHFPQQSQHHFSGSQSPATNISQSPRHDENNPFSPNTMQRPMNTVSPHQGSASPQQGPTRHGSP